jgi:hypothetical protein
MVGSTRGDVTGREKKETKAVIKIINYGSEGDEYGRCRYGEM